ncbi:Uncharacterized protein OS=Corallococcus coralloides (strain ATCC 25202 / DSM 2259 / NBRC 100086 / M2) GN=COCOR_00431 PE=4 SV=1 [Gemmata massiliana]|uniref:RedB protein n=1 Tax=Gemmata massiliana TaxID=1210884 RepID=A0A6P2DBL4_9BACT|nr:RedB protein [Gemmata massiliana]VTR97644.1 Uncharacterized protein OS=Corallococcus coralloides (strain ATCC 25202 / DSM 2259 / NBRC 100086 / M2) GN=COCOR_00431 PE=4 SV=1 [Gemmata massiliana]
MKCGGWIAFGCWLTALMGGVGFLSAHQFTPGQSGTVPPHLSEPEPGARETKRPRLMMFVHPHCPCSPVSLRNFAKVIAGTGAEAVIYVTAENLAETPNGRVARVCAAELRADSDGAIAKRFGAMTSGHVLLYAADGRLVFEGGITDGRGHEGDNPGLRAVTARLSGTEDEPVSFPVFGCPLN